MMWAHNIPATNIPNIAIQLLAKVDDTPPAATTKMTDHPLKGAFNVIGRVFRYKSKHF